MNMNTSAHKKYTLQIGLQRLFRTFSYVPCFKRKEAVGEEGNEFSLFSVICKNKFIYTINGKSENNTKRFKDRFRRVCCGSYENKHFQFCFILIFRFSFPASSFPTFPNFPPLRSAPLSCRLL